MKKFIVISAAVILTMMLCISSFAAPSGFVESPTGKSPVLVSYENSDSNCKAYLVVTPYADRNTLSDEKKGEIETAYNNIVDGNADYTAALEALSAKLGIPVSRLAVSELFDVSYYEDGGHTEHGTFTITVNAKSLANFAGLLCYNNGQWTVVDGSFANGNDLTFSSTELGQFAIVLDTGDVAAETTQPGNSTNTPATGDSNTALWIWGSVAVVALVAIVIICVKSKKVKG